MNPVHSVTPEKKTASAPSTSNHSPCWGHLQCPHCPGKASCQVLIKSQQWTPQFCLEDVERGTRNNLPSWRGFGALLICVDRSASHEVPGRLAAHGEEARDSGRSTASEGRTHCSFCWQQKSLDGWFHTPGAGNILEHSYRIQNTS